MVSPESRTSDSTPSASGLTPAKAPKRIAPRFYQLKQARSYGYSPEVDQTAGGRPVLVVLPI